MKKKSKYKPKGVRLDTMAWVLSGMKPVSQVQHAGLALKIKNHDALANITQGRGKRDDIDLVIAAMNVAEALGMMGLGADWRAEINAAQEAIYQMGKRGLRNGDKFLFTGPEMQAVNLGMDVHDAQLDECTVKQLEQALSIVEREIRLKRAKMIKEEECLPQ
jgi:hypothetical protein